MAGGGQGAAHGYATTVLQGTVCSKVVHAVFQGDSISHASNSAQSTLVEVLRQTLASEGDQQHDLHTQSKSALLDFASALACMLGAATYILA